VGDYFYSAILVIEILLALILVDGRGIITSIERTFVVLQLVTKILMPKEFQSLVYILHFLGEE
jgi:hypothetical protein